MRISADQTGEQLGVTRQEQDCRELATRLGWAVAEVYVDNDISAYKHRPGYQRMLTDIQTGLVDAIIAWAPDRIYRKMKDLESLIEIIEAHGVQVATVKAGELDLSSAYGRMIARILGSVASGEGEIKAERWSRSYQQRREQGMRLRTGNRLFGYTDDMEILDHEAAITRVMAAKIREGGAILGTARWLHDQGVTTTLGKPWSPQGIKRYLTNPRIAGYSTIKGEIVAEGGWEPILDRDTFEVVRAMLTARTRPYVPQKSLLLGLLHCGRCGQRMITGQQRTQRTYRCPNRPNMPGCGRCSGNAEPIEEYVEGYAKQRLSDDRVRESIARLRTHPTEQLAEITALEKRIIELEAQLSEPDVPVAALMRGINTAKARREELAGALADTAGAILLPAPGQPWPEDRQRRRALIDLVVARVELAPAAPGWGSGRGFDYGRVQITRR
jgi:DNA invertase Pin-like site-specific DNA recombinase